VFSARCSAGVHVDGAMRLDDAGLYFGREANGSCGERFREIGGGGEGGRGPALGDR